MIITTLLATVAAHQSNWPSQASLKPGEVMRHFERSMSRRGTTERLLVLTSNKVFVKDGKARNWAMLTRGQQTELRMIFSGEPTGLRSHQRENPMWPSSYDGSDQWIAYRIGSQLNTWTNKEYEYPKDEESPLAKFIYALRLQMIP